MKAKILLSLAIFCMSRLSTYAQTDVKINPIGALFGSPDISAEFGVNESVGIEPLLGISFGSVTVLDEKFKSSGFRVGAIGKYYFNPDKGTDKFWAGLYLRGGGSTSKTSGSTNESFSNRRMSAGLALGYKWVSRKNIVFELGFGAGRALINKFEVESGSVNLAEVPLLNIDILGRISVGYRFGGDSGGSKKR
jgi:hypothetical protein